METETENENSYAEIEKEFPQVTASIAKNGHNVYRIEGKVVSKDEARKVAGELSDKKVEFIFNEVEKNLGIVSKDDGQSNLLISFETPDDKLILQNEKNFETFEDAIKAARYIKENFDDVDFINVSSGEYLYATDFRINEDGETFLNDEVKEKIEKMDAETDNKSKIAKEEFDTPDAVKAKIKELKKSTQDKGKIYKQQIDLMIKEIEKSTGLKLLPKNAGGGVTVHFAPNFGEDVEFWKIKKPLDALAYARYLFKNYSDVIDASFENRVVAVEYKEGFSIYKNGVEEIQNEFVQRCSEQVLQDLKLENLSPSKNDSLGKIYGKMNGDGTISANFEKEIEDAEKLQRVKDIAQKVGGNFNAEVNIFNFENLTDAAIFFKSVREAFYGTKNKTASKNKKTLENTKVELPKSYKFVEGGFLESPFIATENGDSFFGEIDSEIENATNGTIKVAPLRLKFGDKDSGYVQIVTENLEEIKNGGYKDALSFVKDVVQNVNKIYSRADTGNVAGFILHSEGNSAPVDLEVEKISNDEYFQKNYSKNKYYKIIAAYPSNAKEKIEGILIFDKSTVNDAETETAKPDVKKVDTLITAKKAANGVINYYLTSDRITESRWGKSSVDSQIKSGTAVFARDVTDEIKYKLAELRMYHNSPKTDETKEIKEQLDEGKIAPKTAYDKLKEILGEDDKYLDKINELVENSFSVEKANKKSEVLKNNLVLGTNGDPLSRQRLPAVLIGDNLATYIYNGLRAIVADYNGKPIYDSDFKPENGNFNWKSKDTFEFETEEDRDNFFKKATELIPKFEKELAEMENLPKFKDLPDKEQRRRNNLFAEYKNLKIDEETKNLLHKSYSEIKECIDYLINFAEKSFGTNRKSNDVIEAAKKYLAMYLQNESLVTKFFKFDSAIKSMYEIFDSAASNAQKNIAIREQARELIKKWNHRELTPEQAYGEMAKLLGLSTKLSARGELEPDFKNVIEAKNLNSKQKAITEFAKRMGTPINFFKGRKDLHGAFRNGEIYLNANSATSYDWTFWHEVFHWMVANNPALYSEIVDAVEISQAQIEDYRSEIGREKLSDAETIEEILADNMKETASRVGLLQRIGKKNKSLVERLISWLKSVMDKFTDFFNTPAAGLTRDQKNKMYETFGQMARSIVDEDGNKIFRFNKSTKNIELANGENLPNVNLSMRDTNTESEDIQRNIESGRAAIEKVIKNHGKVSAAMHREDIGDIDILWGWAGDADKDFKNGYGISHIIARREIKNLNGELVAKLMPDIIMKGEKISDKNSTRIQFNYNGYTAILSKTWQGKPVNHWLLTGFVNAKTEPASERGEVYDSTAPTARTPGRFQRTGADDSVSNENISQFEDEGNTKYSINNNDNSFATFRKKLANKFFGERSGRFRKQMKNALEELTGYKIAAGHLAEGDILVKPKPKVIRTKNEYAWENTPEFMPAVGKIVAENLNLAPSEKMNNYIASWILDGAPNNTSAEAKDFQRAMRAADEEYRDKLFDAQSKFIAWENKSAMEKMQAIISSERDEPEFGEKFKAARAEGYAQLFEDIAPIKNLVDEIEKETGKKLLHSENPYIAFRNYKGMAGRAKMMLEGNETTIEILQETYPHVNFKGFKTLNTILQKVGADKDDKIYDELQSYAVACHLKEIHEKNKQNLEAQKRRQATIENLQNRLIAAKTQSEIDELKEKLEKSKNRLEEIKKNFYITPLSEKECDEIISKYGKKYGAAQQDLVRYSNTLLAIIHDSGLMGKFKYEGLLERWKNYVPLHRLFDENENLAYGDSLKTMEGSARDIIDPIQAIIESTNSFIKRAEKNKAKILLAGLVRCNGVGNLIEEVDGKKPDDRTTITFLENGVKKYLQTDPAVVKAVNNLSPPQMNWFLRFLRLGTTITRNFMTLLNPNFAIRNWARDMQDAYLYSGKYNRNVWDIFEDIWRTPILTIQGIASALKQDADFQEWMIHGGAQASFWSMDRNYTQASIEKLTRGRLKNAPLWTRIKDRGTQALHFLQAIGEYSEIGTRIGQYKKVKQHLAKLHGGKNTYDDLVTAAFESRDLMDFARGGASSRSWNVLTAFANAHLQGIDKFCRTFSLSKRKTAEGRKELGYSILRLMLSSVLPAMFFFMINHDEDWYKEDLNDWERRSHWILGENFRVPKGMDFGIRFMSNLTEDFLRWSYNKDKVKFTETFAQPFLDELPDMFPTLFQPIIEAMVNYDMFTKNPIVPRRLQNLPEELQYDDRTSGIAKYLGEKTGNSPKKIEHILFGFTGNMGKGATRLADMTFGDKKFSWSADWLPLVGGFFRVPYRNPKIINEYYEQLDAQTKLHNEYQLTGEKPEGYDENLYKRIKKVQKEMKKLGNLERAAVENLNLDSTEKDRRQIAIQKKRIALVEKVMQ